QNPALLSQGRTNFSGRSEASSLPPQENKFASNLRVPSTGLEPVSQTPEVCVLSIKL
ncbi:unnamed protein product, partial [marine sediment metagenome]